jgi:histidine triad (HIT) family protein
MNNCIFCKIVTQELPAHTLWENESFLAFLDNKPLNPGHILIIPKKHQSYVFDLDEPVYSELFQVAKVLAAPLQRAVQAQRIGVAIEGFSVDHVHLHLVPLNAGGELDPGRAEQADQRDLVRIKELIKKEVASQCDYKWKVDFTKTFRVQQ